MKKIIYTFFILLFSLTAFWCSAATLNGAKYPTKGWTVGSSNSASYKQGVGLNRGLVGWWTMDGADVTATQVLDKSGQGNTVTRTAVTPVAGKIGRGMSFNGTTSVLQNATPPAISGDASVTLSAWIKKSISTIDSETVVGFRGDGGVGSYLILTLNNNGAGSVDLILNSCSPSSASGIILPNKWYHIVAVKTPGVTSDTTLKFYVNGVYYPMVTASACTPAYAFTNTWIGSGFNVSSVWPFNGSIDDVRVYNRALSRTEVAQLYAQGGSKIAETPQKQSQFQGKGINAGLVGWWTMDGADVNATQVYDKSGQNNTGTITGGVTKVAGKLGQGMKFNGTSGYVRATGFQPQLNSGLSFSVWAKPASFVTPINLLANHLSSSIDIRINSTTSLDACFGGFVVGVNCYMDAPVTLVAGKWHLITITFDGTAVNVYQDGVFRGQSNLSNPNANWDSDLIIGARTAAGNEYFNGSLDDARIYSRALSFAEVKQLYAMGGGR